MMLRWPLRPVGLLFIYSITFFYQDGKGSNVGNPLSKDFLALIESGVLKSLLITAENVLKLTKMCSYWKNNKDRIS